MKKTPHSTQAYRREKIHIDTPTNVVCSSELYGVGVKLTGLEIGMYVSL